MGPIKLFYCYAENDLESFGALDKHLRSALKGTVEAWDETAILAGSPWKQTISEHIEAADLILLLVSSDFLASPEIQPRIARALARHQSGAACLIPVLIRPVIWETAPFGNLLPLPDKENAVTTWTNRDEAWVKVVKGVERALEDWKLRRLVRASFTPAEEPPATASLDPAFAALPRVELSVEITPPLPGVELMVCSAGGKLLHAAGHTTSARSIVTWSIPATEVAVTARYVDFVEHTATRVEVVAKLDLGGLSRRTVTLALPYSLAYAENELRRRQRRHDLLDLARRYRAVAALGLFFLLVSPTVLYAVYQHRTVDPQLMYVPPIYKYKSGVGLSGLNPHSRAYGVLRVLENLAKRPGVNKEVLFEAAYDNPPQNVTLDQPVYLDQSEATVPEYDRYLQKLSGAAQDQARPLFWVEQKDQNTVSKDRRGQAERPFPVYGVRFDQAQAFCTDRNGRLPKSEEWEIAARNLKPIGQEPALDPEHPEARSHDTLYPWGERFVSNVTQTAEAKESSPARVCSREDKTKHSPHLCDLGGNLREWTQTPRPSRDGYYLRGASYHENGEIGAMGYIRHFSMLHPLPDDLWTEMHKEDASAEAARARTYWKGVGFRCAYDVRPKSPYTAELLQGEYKIGRPDDEHIFTYLVRSGDDGQYFLQEDKEMERVGDFFVQAHKVKQTEYRTFLRQTNHGHGPWCQELGEPADVKHQISDRDNPDGPAVGVSWYDAHAYCAWRNMRLPTAEEWERIVRGSSEALFAWGADGSADDKVLEQQFHAFLQPTPRLPSGEPMDPTRELVRSMWSDASEWTNSQGWEGGDAQDTRVFKGLFMPSAREHNEKLLYLTTVRYPWTLSRKMDDIGVGFRCVLERVPTLSERLFFFVPSARMSRHVVSTPLAATKKD